MSVVALAVVALVVLLLILAGAIVGWVIGTNDEHIDVLARRLAAEQQVQRLTRDTLRQIRDAARQRSS